MKRRTITHRSARDAILRRACESRANVTLRTCSGRPCGGNAVLQKLSASGLSLTWSGGEPAWLEPDAWLRLGFRCETREYELVGRVRSRRTGEVRRLSFRSVLRLDELVAASGSTSTRAPLQGACLRLQPLTSGSPQASIQVDGVCCDADGALTGTAQLDDVPPPSGSIFRGALVVGSEPIGAERFVVVSSWSAVEERSLTRVRLRLVPSDAPMTPETLMGVPFPATPGASAGTPLLHEEAR